MFCHKCGAEIPDESQFCSKCGAKVMLSNTDAPKLENHDLETDVITEKRERLPVKQIKRRRRKKKHWLLLILTIFILAFLVNEAVRFSNIGIYAYSTVTINSKDPVSSEDEEKMDSLFRDRHLMVINDSDYYLFNLDSGLGDKIDTWIDSLKENGYTTELSTSGEYAFIKAISNDETFAIAFSFKKVPFMEKLNYYISNR